MKYSIFTNIFNTTRQSMLLLCLTSLTACITNPELYNEQDPLQAQTRDLKDTDLDGVINARDLCLTTPDDAVISNDGCEKLTGKPKVKYRVIDFGFDKYHLSKIEQKRVVEMATFLNKYPETSLYLIGDTSIEGTNAYNEKLAKRRINTVQSILLKNNVAANRLKDEVYNMKNHIPASLQGRKTRLIAVLQWPKDYKDYEVKWDIFTESEKTQKSIK
ncbi:OmpA family protein [Colwellia echini]|uniref:OmpA family protein n=1 Tax=Colwellia echini TaxID=1982103 RepID=A0ABY3MZS0_9GAMM|nr:OmpA family protein [Colwellia echini]TYK66723.1 OmpA family protein [Colwellia echini]